MPKGGKRDGAGRPIGSKANHTIQADAAKARLVEMFVAEREPIYQALIDEAKKGNVPAIKELFERVWGKVPQAISNDEDKAFLIQWTAQPTVTIHGPNINHT